LGEKPPIGRVAARVGLSIDTIRYYERAGLMVPVARAPSGHRRYAEADLEWITLLKCLRTTGMPISEMRRFADLVGRGEPTRAQRHELLEKHRSKLRRRLQEIAELMPKLDEKISSYGPPEADGSEARDKQNRKREGP